MEWLIHVANLLFLASYAVRDILWLRALSVLASTTLIAWFAAAGDAPQWSGIAWQTVFLTINAVRLVRLVAERRPVVLAPDEECLHRLVFRALRPRQMLTLSQLGAWERVEPRAHLARAGEPLSRLFVIATGRAGVEVDGERVTELGPGSLVGEMSFLTDAVPRASVIASEPVHVLAWDKVALRAYLEQEPEVRTAFQQAIGADLCAKLASA